MRVTVIPIVANAHWTVPKTWEKYFKYYKLELE